MTKQQFEKFDIIIAVSIFLLTLGIIINKLFLPNISLAIYNFIFSILPFIYLFFKGTELKLYKKKIYFFLFIIICIRLFTSLMSAFSLSNTMILEQIVMIFL